MYEPVLFRDRERPAQIVIGGVIPAIAGAVAGILVGASSHSGASRRCSPWSPRSQGCC
jgi:hypothetical protein